MTTVARHIFVQGTCFAPDRDSIEPEWTTAKAWFTDSPFAGFG